MKDVEPGEQTLSVLITLVTMAAMECVGWRWPIHQLDGQHRFGSRDVLALAVAHLTTLNEDGDASLPGGATH